MTPTTNALLVCVVLLCGLQETVLSRRGHCTGNQCFALFRDPKDFPGAQSSCKDSGGQLLAFSLERVEKLLGSPASPASGTSGRFWLELPSAGRTTADAAARNCPSVSVSTRREVAVLREPCREQLDGFLCQYTFSESCTGVQADGGAQVTYVAYRSFQVDDSERYPPGTVAEATRAGGEHPDSRHVCFSGGWLRAPWRCEVLRGGCEHRCTPATHTCACPAGQSLHPNNVTCAAEPCAVGYRPAPDGGRCVDVDECVEENPCTGEGEECENTRGGFECRCKDGFDEEDGACVDVAICESCEHMRCEKLGGVYGCVCRDGFRVSAKDPTRCEQHCPERDCPAICVPNAENGNEPQCFCPDGYIQDVMNGTHICTDIDECENERPCEHECENVLGGYRCSCHEGFELHNEDTCVPTADQEGDGSGSAAPGPTRASTHPATVPSYIKTGSVLGIGVFMALCAVLLFFLIRNVAKRCGRFELSSFKRPDIDIFYLQQVTTETYKRLSFDNPFKNDSQTPSSQHTQR